MNEKRCPLCKTGFTPRIHNQKFCTTNCQEKNKARIKHEKVQKRVPKINRYLLTGFVYES